MRVQFFKYLIIPFIWSAVALANPSLSLQVTGLFRDHAVIEINGQQHILKVGQESPEGVKLLEADSNMAIVAVDGVKQTLPLGTQISGTFTPPAAQPTVSLWPTGGMYFTNGHVNGYSVNFLVDTGASAVAMNAETATRLGIDYLNAPMIGIRTASGTGTGYQVTLNQVQVGDINRSNVRAVVLDGPEPEHALLGMSFLQDLDIQRTGERLDLIQKF
ncbi:retropepsin-like aspartic protease family protein [Methylophaga sp. OBS3]|uniref:retropepsin-like aspartic protease family protein n=1 Tax=Methylophaga sp. OBS3 TaxID=2991934 RepID=UPI00224D6FE4|nr:TIGR02281 family clan AA aspartic protease [Methylophaga sp. OBS3]MCX4190194.1 TIGR02281 family clan AA aspartic protease [Methylophaga sp. OBS3]